MLTLCLWFVVRRMNQSSGSGDMGSVFFLHTWIKSARELISFPNSTPPPPPPNSSSLLHLQIGIESLRNVKNPTSSSIVFSAQAEIIGTPWAGMLRVVLLGGSSSWDTMKDCLSNIDDFLPARRTVWAHWQIFLSQSFPLSSTWQLQPLGPARLISSSLSY